MQLFPEKRVEETDWLAVRARWLAYQLDRERRMQVERERRKRIIVEARALVDHVERKNHLKRGAIVYKTWPPTNSGSGKRTMR
jgi:hypothetical protein